MNIHTSCDSPPATDHRVAGGHPCATLRPHAGRIDTEGVVPDGVGAIDGMKRPLVHPELEMSQRNVTVVSLWMSRCTSQPFETLEPARH